MRVHHLAIMYSVYYKMLYIYVYARNAVETERIYRRIRIISSRPYHTGYIPKIWLCELYGRAVIILIRESDDGHACLPNFNNHYCNYYNEKRVIASDMRIIYV